MKRFIIILLLAVCVSGTAYSADPPVFDENSANITNKYFPILPGKVLIYNLFTKAEEEEPVPTGMVNYWHCAGPDIVDGVKCLRVNRITRMRGKTPEEHYDNAMSSDWYAQSVDGSVYILQILNYHKPVSEFVTYGRANAQLHMGPEELIPLHPDVDVEDITLGATGLGTFKGCVKATHSTIGTVYCAPGIGPVRNINIDGHFNELIGWEFPFARQTDMYDVSGDGKTGLEEAIYSLQALAGLSSDPGNFTLGTDVFSDGVIPAKYSCDENAVSPPLSWTSVPAGTKSFVLIMDNLDALPVTGYPLDHWLVYDIPASVTALAENAAANLPSGAKHGANAKGKEEYQKPCPPDGAPATRYYFKLYALDIDTLNPYHTNKAGIEAAMIGHVIGQTKIVGTVSPL